MEASGFKAFSSTARLLSRGEIMPLWQQQRERDAHPASQPRSLIWPLGTAEVSPSPEQLCIRPSLSTDRATKH